MLGEVELDGGLQHRNFNRLAAAAAGDLVERRHDGVGDRLAGELVADHCRHIGRLTVHLREQSRDTGAGLNQIVIGGLVGIRTIRAKAVSTTVDDVRLDGAHSFIVVAQAANGIGALVMHEHIGALEQFVERGRDTPGV